MLQKHHLPMGLLLLLAFFSWHPLAASPQMTNLFASTTGSGTACTQAAPCTLATAVSQATANDTVYAAAGTYTGADPDFHVIGIGSAISLLGGWNGAPTGTVVRNPAVYVSILDGENERRGITMSTASTVDGFTIRNGAGVAYGAGILVDTGATGTAVISHNIFQDNIAIWYGGGIGIEPEATAVIENNQFYGNQSGDGSMSAYYGGGLFTRLDSTVSVSGNHFENNQGSAGGAIATDRTNITVTGNKFIANNSPTAVDLSASGSYTALISNNLFQENVGISLRVNSIGYNGGHILHNTFVANGSGGVETDALDVGYDVTVNVLNNIFADHTGASIFTHNGGSVSGSRNLFWQNGSDPHLLVSPIQADPGFMPDGYHLGPASAAIDAGVDVGVTNDIDGEMRPQAGSFDIGADESPYGPPEAAQPGPTFTVTVKDDDDDGICGLIHCSLREAINAANDQAGLNTIVFDGSLSGYIQPASTLPFVTEALTINGPGSAIIILNGGLIGNAPIMRVSSGHLTVQGLTFYQGGGLLNPAGGGLLAEAPVTLSDVHFSHNRAQTGGALVAYQGATLTNVAFYDNESVSNDGGAMAAYNGTVTITNGRFHNNSAAGNGGAIFAQTNFLNISSSHFTNNVASGSSGGAIHSSSQVMIERSSFQYNHVEGSGGGLALVGSANATLTNLLLAENTAADDGAALYLGGNALTRHLRHVTIANPEQQAGTAVYMNGSGTLNISNSIIANHSTGLEQAAGTIAENYNLFYDNGSDRVNVSAGANSLNGNPRFVSPAQGDYRLGTRSWAVDRGTDAGVTVDFEGHVRPLGGGFDIGYDEQIRQRVLAPGSLTFEDSGVQMNVNQVGDLDSIGVILVEADHPNAAGEIGLGHYWVIDGQTAVGDDATGFSLDLTLPRDGADDPTICRYDGQQWDCGRHSFDDNTVTRQGVNAFSDWAVGSGHTAGYTLYLPLLMKP